MSDSINLAKYYFKLSNESNFKEIKRLFTKTTTYSSENTGVYLGSDEIIRMQRKYRSSFEKLKWTINNIEEKKPELYYSILVLVVKN